MTSAIDDLSDSEIRTLAVKLRRRRIGNRLQLALVKLRHSTRRLELFKLRARWARKFGEYECVGGPLDGRWRPCLAHSVYISVGGYYEIDRSDMRLHFQAKTHVPSWRRDD